MTMTMTFNGFCLVYLTITVIWSCVFKRSIDKVGKTYVQICLEVLLTSPKVLKDYNKTLTRFIKNVSKDTIEQFYT